MEAYPSTARERDRWILAQRPARNPVTTERPAACFIEKERAESGDIVSVATLFLTNRECPWRCLMCDLWKNTLTTSVPAGAIPRQIETALSELAGHRPAPRQIKLYNSGSFFDPRAIPPEDYPRIARQIASFERVIVECHPALVGGAAVRFRDLLGGQLEVAMGLETVHPKVLPRLNKRMTLEQFSRAADFLQSNRIALRTFILVKPPFLEEAEAQYWAERSIDFSFECQATAAVLIPTRFGNGALEALAKAGAFSAPALATLEAALEHGIALKKGRVFADLWDLERLRRCPDCFELRRARLERLNLQQQTESPILCSRCNRGASPIRDSPIPHPKTAKTKKRA